jgi:hypothetical protein
MILVTVSLLLMCVTFLLSIVTTLPGSLLAVMMLAALCIEFWGIYSIRRPREERGKREPVPISRLQEK